jgi:hypothetical protein
MCVELGGSPSWLVPDSAEAQLEAPLGARKICMGAKCNSVIAQRDERMGAMEQKCAGLIEKGISGMLATSLDAAIAFSELL